MKEVRQISLIHWKILLSVDPMQSPSGSKQHERSSHEQPKQSYRSFFLPADYHSGNAKVSCTSLITGMENNHQNPFKWTLCKHYLIMEKGWQGKLGTAGYRRHTNKPWFLRDKPSAVLYTLRRDSTVLPPQPGEEILGIPSCFCGAISCTSQLLWPAGWWHSQGLSCSLSIIAIFVKSTCYMANSCHRLYWSHCSHSGRGRIRHWSTSTLFLRCSEGGLSRML